MADFTITGFSSTGRTLINGETGFIGQDAELVTASDAITGSGTNYVTVNGSVATFSGGFSAYDFDGTVMNLFIGRSGMMNGTNSDTVSASASSAMRVSNAGVLFSGEDALDLRASDEGASLHVNNTGDIFGESDGIVTGSGTSQSIVFNSGVITGQAGYGIASVNSVADAGETVYNSGTIQGASGSLYLSSNTTNGDIVYNTGTLFGDVELRNGDDFFDSDGGSLNGTVFGGDGNDTLLGSDGADMLDGGNDNDLLSGRDGNDDLVGGSGENTLLGGVGDDTLSGGGDQDRMFGGAGDDLMIASFGADRMYGGTGDDSMDGGVGNDWMYGGADNDTLDGGGGADLLYGNMGDDSLFGGLNAFSDTIHGGSGNDTLDGGDGVDFLYGGANDDSLIGGTNNDELHGDWGNDTLLGGGGLDTLDGGTGDDILSGGANPDTFVFGRDSGDDVITDFTNGLDVMDITALGLGGYSDLTGAGAVSSFDGGGSTLIDLSVVGGDGSILLDGFAFANLNSADFIF